MKIRGINYDVGTKTITGGLTRESFLAEDVKTEMDVIMNTLHCTAVRVSGMDIPRLVLASEIALGLGLTVWFSPALQYADQVDTLYHISRSAAAAEKLRLQYGKIIFVTGCEFTLFTEGFVPGDTGEKRMKNLFSPLSILKNMIGISRRYNLRLNRFLIKASTMAKEHFHGQITYASGTWEKIDWEHFDIIGIDHYRSMYNKSTYRQEIKKYAGLSKPVSIMEFGCCTYQGAADKGALGWAIVDWTKTRPELKGSFIRDEKEQADYLVDLLDIFQAEHIFAAFVFTFMTGNYIYDEDPRFDLDMASFGVVKVVSDRLKGFEQKMPWAPKLSFYRLGNFYESLEKK